MMVMGGENISVVRTISKEYEIAVAHQLNLPYESRCRNLHGHNVKIEVQLCGELNENGMIVDFHRLDEIVMKYDHKNLNDFFEMPTVEVLSEAIAREIIERFKNVKSVNVKCWESRKASAEVNMWKL